MELDAKQHRPTPVRLAQSPALWAVDDFLTGTEITAVLSLFASEDFVTAHADHYGEDECGFSAEVRADSHPVLSGLMAKVEAAVGKRSCLMPTFRFRHYAEGNGHPPHTDGYTLEGARLAITALMTLEEAAEGGETRFGAAQPEPVSVAGRAGRLVSWTSTVRGGADDPTSEHEGAAVRGAKSVLMAFLSLPPESHDSQLELTVTGASLAAVAGAEAAIRIERGLPGVPALEGAPAGLQGRLEVAP